VGGGALNVCLEENRFRVVPRKWRRKQQRRSQGGHSKGKGKVLTIQELLGNSASKGEPFISTGGRLRNVSKALRYKKGSHNNKRLKGGKGGPPAPSPFPTKTLYVFQEGGGI